MAYSSFTQWETDRQGWEIEGKAMSRYHEELNKGEVFLGNVPAKRGPRDCFKNIKSLRVGEQAYDIHGKMIPQDYMRPMFIAARDEAEYDRIYAAQMRLNGPAVQGLY